MPTHAQITVEPDENQTASGSKANRAALKSMFATAPYHNDYTKEQVKALGQALLLDGEVNDMGHTFGTYNRDYTDAPDYGDVEVGAGGLPASAWSPNPSSPADGVNNPGSMPAAPDGDRLHCATLSIADMVVRGYPGGRGSAGKFGDDDDDEDGNNKFQNNHDKYGDSSDDIDIDDAGRRPL